jgi:hypothetical protein
MYGPVFGAELLFHRISQIRIFQPPPITNTQIATIIAAGITATVAIGIRHTVIKWPSAPSRETVFMVVGSSILTATFFLNTNFDYRCVFMIFTIPYLSFCRTFAAKLAIGLSVYVMWAVAIHDALGTLGAGRLVTLSSLIEFSVTYILIALLMSATISLLLAILMENKKKALPLVSCVHETV